MKHEILKHIAEATVSKNVNSACFYWLYQGKIPEACKKFKK